MKKAAALLFGMVLCFSVKAQELYNLTLPASTLPKGTVGVRLFNESYSESGLIRKITELKVMYGISPKITVTFTGVASDYHSLYLPVDFILHDHSGAGTPPSANIPEPTPNPYIFAGCDLYAQYRFLSQDRQNTHFRMAAFGEASYVRIASHLGEPKLLTHNSGFGAGLISTYLKSHFAGTVTLGYVVPTEYNGNAFDKYGGIFPTTIKYGNAFNYNLAFGYLLFPRHYTTYNQTNLNLYLEFLGRSYGPAHVTQKDGTVTSYIANTPFLSGGTYMDISPGVQLIIKSSVRVDLSVGLPFINSSFIHQYPLYYIGLQRYFFFRKHNSEKTD